MLLRCGGDTLVRGRGGLGNPGDHAVRGLRAVQLVERIGGRVSLFGVDLVCLRRVGGRLVVFLDQRQILPGGCGQRSQWQNFKFGFDVHGGLLLTGA